MSYVPLLSFGPSAIVAGSAYLLRPPLGDGVPRQPCRRHDLIRPLLTSAPRSGCLAAFSVAEATPSRSPGVSSVTFRAQVAGSTLRILDGYGLRGKWPARPTLAPCIRFLSIDSHVCPTLPSDLASRR